MKRSFDILIFITALLLIPALSTAGNTEMVVSVDAGYTDNVFGDSDSYSDAYTAPSAQLSIYPTSSLRLNFTGKYTAYRSITGLNQIFGGANITYVNADPNSLISAYLTAGYDVTDYGQDYNLYDQTQPYLSGIIRARLISPLVISTGGHFKNMRYTNSDYSDYNQYNLFAGLYLNLPADNSLYTEAGFTSAEFDVLTNAREHSAPASNSSYDPITRLDFRYYLLRLSRPLASHTGLNLQFRSQTTANRQGAAFFGYSLDNLSPWNQFQYGESISGGLKSFIVPNFIINAGAQWSDMAYFDVIETDSNDETYLKSRNDETINASLEIQRPFGGNGKTLITPVLYLAYINNRSSDPNYQFDSYSVSVGFKIQL